MAGISVKCENDVCKHRRGCLRHEAKSKMFGQASAHYAPDANDQCKDFVPLGVAKYLNSKTVAQGA